MVPNHMSFKFCIKKWGTDFALGKSTIYFSDHENLPSSERAKHDAQKGCKMHLNGITSPYR